MGVSTGRFWTGIPARFLGAVAVAFALMVYVAVDQMHWWQAKPDYAFGWFVPLFVIYLVAERWPRLRKQFEMSHPSPLEPVVQRTLAAGFGLLWCVGAAVFVAGALYRAGAGVSQPGSLAMALGFAGVALGTLYFNSPAAGLQARQQVGVGASLAADVRLRSVGLFLFPALIWILSAPLVTAVENAVSLFLLQKVVVVVFATFDFLGYPLLREGNVLILPRGQVGVVDACSGIRSLTGCLFAGAFLGAVFLDRLWKKLLLMLVAALLAFATNLLRSFFLTGWAYAHGSEAIEGPLHDYSGFAVLGLTAIGLFALLPLFDARRWRRWLALETAPAG
jgi:exosortase